MFSLRFSGSKFFINLRLQFRVRKIFHAQVFAAFLAFSYVSKIIIPKMRNLLGCYFIKMCSLTDCKQGFLF